MHCPRSSCRSSVSSASWNFLLILYLPYYVFRSMRVVYGEGRLRTSLKFTALAVIYFVLLGVTMLAASVYAALALS